MPRSFLTISGGGIEPREHLIEDARTAKQLFKARVDLLFEGKSMWLKDEEGKEVVVPAKADVMVNFYERWI